MRTASARLHWAGAVLASVLLVLVGALTLTQRDMFYVARSSLPFFLLMVSAVAIIWVFPVVVSFLPSQMFDLRK